MSSRLLFQLSLLSFLTIASGCGTKRTASANVTGKVTFNGQPLTGGNMYFHSEAGIYPASIDGQGNYRLFEIPPGDMTVTVDNEFLDPNKKTPTYTGGDRMASSKKATPGGGAAGKYGAVMSGPSGAPAVVNQYKGKGVENAAPPEGAQIVKDGTYIKLPDLYKKRETSTIKIKIESGDNDRNIELTGK